MRKWLLRLFYFGLIAYVLLFLGAAIAYWYSRPELTGVEKLPGLHGKVVITRDQYGVPHIVASASDLDAFYALGYVHAQDRFWQMEYQRRVAQGTLSEIFGHEAVAQDSYLRTWGFYRAAAAAWPALSPQTKQIVQAYTDGVNAFINQGHFPLQVLILNYHPHAWTAIDTLAWQKLVAWNLQTVWRQKLTNEIVAQKIGIDQLPILFPSYPANAPITLTDADLAKSNLLKPATAVDPISAISPQQAIALEQLQQITDKVINELHINNAPGKGSNAWVFAGKWTTSGKPLLTDGLHLDLQMPNMWYLVELKGPHLHVTGATIPGMPAVVIGHNDKIAWGMTNVNSDSQDLYLIPPSAKVAMIADTINVKFSQPVPLSIQVSDVGPIISNVSEAGEIAGRVAIRWPALMANDTTLQSMLEVDYANNWQEFVSALKDFVVPAQNFFYADVDGNIGYYLAGKIPVRDWSSALPVSDDQNHQWLGYVPFDKLPHVYNPEAGMIVNANNRVVSNAYPYPLVLRWSEPPFRINRILELLNHAKPLTITKSETTQLDTSSTLWKSLAPRLLATKPLDASSEQALALLKTWDGNTNLDSVSATIFAYWYRELSNMTPSVVAQFVHWPDPLFIQDQIVTNGKYCSMAGGGDCQKFLSQSLQTAMRKLTKDLGNNPEHWQWQRIHHAIFTELGSDLLPGVSLLWNRDIATPGSLYTVDVAPFDFGNFRQYVGENYRQIIDLANLDQSMFIQPPGQSNDPFSKHYSDLMPLWRDGKYIAINSDDKTWGSDQQLVLQP